MKNVDERAAQDHAIVFSIAFVIITQVILWGVMYYKDVSPQLLLVVFITSFVSVVFAGLFTAHGPMPEITDAD